MLTAMFVLAIIALVLFALAVAAVFTLGKNSPAVPAFGLLAALVNIALAVVVVIGFFVGV